MTTPAGPLSHAELGASNAERWLHCLGSPRMERGLPNVETPYTREGTVAHAVANWHLTGYFPASRALGAVEDDTTITEEMVDAVLQFVEVVEAARQVPGAKVWLEQQVSLARLNPPGPMFGTTDAMIYQPDRRKLVVVDFKYGAGVLVEAKDNPQGRYYALGGLLTLEEMLRTHDLVDTVEIVIVQPRAYHPAGIVRRETLTYAELLAFGGELLAAARATRDPQAPLTPGPWCRFCRAAGHCAALKAHASELAMTSFERHSVDRPPNPETLPAEVLADVLDKADILEDWLRAVRQTVQTKLEQGETVPGWKLVPKRATRKWREETEAVAFAQSVGMAPEQYLKTTLQSPRGFELVLKPLGLELPAALYTQESSGNTIAPSADRRQEVNPVEQVMAFFEAEAPKALPAPTTPAKPKRKRTTKAKGQTT